MSGPEGFFISSNGSSEVSNVVESFASDMHILLVDDDKELLISTARMLELCSYKVTIVELASTAMLMLQKGNETFDLVMVNVQPHDISGFQLLREVHRLSIPLILLSSSHSNHDMAKAALATGAILFLQRPASLEVLKYIWQLVLVYKRRRDTQLTLKGKEICERRIAQEEEYIISNWDDGVEIQDKTTNNNRLIKKKECTQWTKELHAKFLDAINMLGPGRCYPKEILRLMNVPGLTRMQVASHLQKCRNFRWKTQKENKISTSNRRSNSPEIIDPYQSENHMMNYFGNMAQLPTDKDEEPLQTQTQNGYYPQIPHEAPDQWNNGNNILGRNIQGNGEDHLAHQFAMSNISTSKNHYLPPQHHQFHETYGGFSS